MPLLCLSSVSVTAACPLLMLVGVQPTLVRGAGSVKAGSVVLVPAGLTQAGCVSAGLGSSNSTDFLKTVPPVIIFIPELSCLVIQMYAVPSYLQIKPQLLFFFFPSSPHPLFPSCLLLCFILVKHKHLNIMVTISTSKIGFPPYPMDS